MKKHFVLSMPVCLLSGGLSIITAQSKPNIIYILTDDLGYGDVSSFNKEGKIKTPNIDKLASEGMKFTDAHTSSAVCSPTRYGILTGRYNWRSRLKEGVLSGISKALIPTSRTTVAKMLQNNGYETAFIGKWHLGWNWNISDSADIDNLETQDFGTIDYSKPITNNPNDLGFNYSYGIAGSLDLGPYVYVENGKVLTIPDTISVNKDSYAKWRKGPISKDFVHEEGLPNFVNRAIQFIDTNSKNKQPFFIYLPLTATHAPILPTDEWKGKSGLNPYGDFVMMLDFCIGEIMKSITDAGIEKNTLVIFTSDNGCSTAANYKVLLEKGHNPSAIYRGTKADLFEGGHRVPFIAKWPNKIKKGSVSNETICTTDFMATCAEIVNYKLKPNEAEDSYSMMPLLTNKKRNKSFREATVHHSINGSFAIRKGDWKLLLCPDSGGWSYPNPKKDQKIIATLPKVQLYNLKDDPSETKNVEANNPEKVKELKSLLLKYIDDGRSTKGIPQENDSINFEWKQLELLKS
ncbi:arylsulfatase [Flavobacterium sp.]|uniref:sulfatase family protein n=1 Tax=Flavobacterium sp. TaxID=239 RepID=UPI00286E367A|nr:arylsulfatase [Flavobacterium sp.]